MRQVTAAVAALLLLIAGLPAADVSAAGPEAGQPKVVVIVGPVGDATARNLERGERAAAEARRWTSNVVTVFSPDATWAATRAALRDASIVVYLGHGNGWPSRYRDGPHPATQNGLGLNPVAGAGHRAHQYFGEAFLAKHVRLAPNAVVLLHHLCYASGNSEPGLPEGTLDEAKQRVDNFAAGWIAAGAAAVVAEAHHEADPYLRALLTSRRSIGDIWRRAPSFHGNAFAFESTRSPGHVAHMDPDRPDGGYHRSLVARLDLTAADLRAGAAGDTPDESVAPAAPSLASLGYAFGVGRIDGGPPVAGAERRVVLPVTAPDGLKIPAGLHLGLRWDPVELDVRPPTSPAGATALPDVAAAGPSPAPAPVPLVTPLDPGGTVDVLASKRGKRAIAANASLPLAPGLHRLTLTLHDRDGVALDTATQELIPDLLVRVTSPLSATYGVVSDFAVDAGSAIVLPVVIANTGTRGWGEPVGPTDGTDPGPGAVVRSPRLVARWLPLGAGSVATAIDGSAPAVVAPGEATLLELRLTAPSEPGQYALLVDVVTLDEGSLAAAGIRPGFVRVTVASPALTPMVATPAPDPGR